METIFATTLLIIFGGCIGSFASMLMYRLPRDDRSMNIISPRSFCPRCKVQLKMYQLIPFFGYLLNKGKCASCKQKIEVIYLLNEILSASLIVFLVNALGLYSPFTWAIFCILIILYIQAMMDFNTLLLSQPLSVLLIIMGLGLNFGFEIFAIPLNSILGLIFGYGLLFSLNLGYRMIRHADGIGSGDFLLLGGIGSIFGASAIGPILLLASSITLMVYYLKVRDGALELPLGFGLGLGGILYCVTYITSLMP